jgi:hypothetical protein
MLVSIVGMSVFELFSDPSISAGNMLYPEKIRKGRFQEGLL